MTHGKYERPESGSGVVSQQVEADVVVVGCGMAGLVAAVSVLEAGGRALVVEKGNRYGGTLWISSGLIWTFRDPQQLRREIPGGNATLQDLVVDRLEEELRWLEERGVRLEAEQDFMWYGRGRRSDPKELALTLAGRIEALGGEIRLRTGMRELRVHQGRVTGVLCDGPEGEVEVIAGGVILATGGFQGNVELLQRYVTPAAERVYLRANPWSTGDAFLAATAIGAAVSTGLDRVYGHALAAPPARFNDQEFQAAGQRYGPLAVALNLDGHRFADESAGTGEETLNAAIAREREATAAFVVDADGQERSYYGGPTARSRIEWLRERNGPVAEADTLEALCEGMSGWGVHPANALATLRRYNECVESEPHRLWPPRAENRWPVSRPPFSAVLVRSGITFTAGGLQVDASMQVLRRSASVSSLPLVSAPVSELIAEGIPGLYAAGCDIGGFSTDRYMGGLSVALVTGRIAARSVVSSFELGTEWSSP